MQFSMPFTNIELNQKAAKKNGIDYKTYQGDSLMAKLNFDVNNGDRLLVKIGVSAVDIDGARKNWRSEIPYWGFE